MQLGRLTRAFEHLDGLVGWRHRIVGAVEEQQRARRDLPTKSSARKSFMLCAVSAGNSMTEPWLMRFRSFSGIGTMS